MTSEWGSLERRKERRERQLVRYPGMKLPEETLAQAAAARATMYRANGNMPCPVCGFEYWRHPEDATYDFLVQLCTGDRVKL